MERVTFIESIIKIMNLIASVPFFIEILILSIILLIAMAFFYFRKSKKGKITSLIIYFVTLFMLPISHLSFFADSLDKIVENYIEILYFPSCYVYIALIIITDVGVFRNIKKHERKWYHFFELFYFFLFQFLFFMIVRFVITEKIDIFERTQLYSDATLTSLLQISSYLFWIRIGIKLVAIIVNKLSKETPIIDNALEIKEDVAKITKNSSDRYIGIEKKEDGIEVENRLNTMDMVSFITELDNVKNPKTEKPKVDLMSSNPVIENEKKDLINNDEKVISSNTKVVTIDDINLDLNDTEENSDFFDDFYE